ncbi:integral peroxisomal membrane peroxin [Aspergillus sp. HF37]|nr:integral peroxisomal membrane peroxin [Aspergillus sp. HF37]
MDEYTSANEPARVISAHDSKSSNAGAQQHMNSGSGFSIQGRLFTQVLKQVVPPEDADDYAPAPDSDPANPPTKRPAFSLPVMTNNFRRFNARIGIVFSFQNKLERLLGWEKSSHTISLLFVYSFVCLDPHLLVIIPIAAGLLFIMVPAFLARHPPPPSLSTSSTAPYYSYDGPALAPATTIEPASETSIDFFRNMRDLQNTMGDFSDMHDSTITMFSPITDFADENLSSTTFLLLTLVAIALFPTAHLLPWRYILLVGGNVAILSNNPTIQSFFRILARDLAEEGRHRAVVAPPGMDGAGDPLGLSMPSTPSAAMSLLGSLADISLDTYPEEREVEIFELQYRSPESHAESDWDHFLFSSMPYDPLSPSRIAGDRPRGCRFFEDVRPPPGWAWKSKRWELDMDCREWVVERMITGVGLESSGSLEEGGEASEEVGAGCGTSLSARRLKERTRYSLHWAMRN